MSGCVPTVGLGVWGPWALALEDKPVVGASGPKQLTGPFKAALKQYFPGSQVEILQKKTAAGGTSIQEIAREITAGPDPMRASASKIW